MTTPTSTTEHPPTAGGLRTSPPARASARPAQPPRRGRRGCLGSRPGGPRPDGVRRREVPRLARKHASSTPGKRSRRRSTRCSTARPATANDPWAIITHAVRITCVYEERAQGLLCSVHQARRAHVSAFHDPERFSERDTALADYHPAFHTTDLRPSDLEPEPRDSPGRAGVHVRWSAAEDAIAMLCLLDWPADTARAAVEHVWGVDEGRHPPVRLRGRCAATGTRGHCSTCRALLGRAAEGAAREPAPGLRGHQQRSRHPAPAPAGRDPRPAAPRRRSDPRARSGRSEVVEAVSRRDRAADRQHPARPHRRSILVGTRHRADLGDIDALAASIDRDGLLQPLTITIDGVLVCGHDAWPRSRSSAGAPSTCGFAAACPTGSGSSSPSRTTTCSTSPTQLEAAGLYREIKQVMAEDAARRKSATQFSSENQPETTVPQNLRDRQRAAGMRGSRRRR